MAAEDFTGEHQRVLDEAQEIFVKRSKTRGQMWLDTPLTRELDMIEEKRIRAEAAIAGGLVDEDFMSEFEDSLLDLINFAVFALKKARRGVRQ